MDSIRYYIALFIVASSPGVFLFWFSVHGLVQFWRRIGPRSTLGIHFALIAALAAVVFFVRDELLSIEFGTQPLLIVAAAILLAISAALRVAQSRRLKIKVLIGLPELAPKEHGQPLVTGGIYARIRHPRYLQMLIAYLGYAFLCNYLATYAVFLSSLLWAYFVARLEERELLDRYGDEYRQYCERVPRFLPHRRERAEPPGAPGDA